MVAARACGMRAPIDGPYLDIKNLEGLEEETRLSRQLGYEGRVVVYPMHRLKSSSAFTPSSLRSRPSSAQERDRGL